MGSERRDQVALIVNVKTRGLGVEPVEVLIGGDTPVADLMEAAHRAVSEQAPHLEGFPINSIQYRR